MKDARSGPGRLLPVLTALIVTLVAADVVLRGIPRAHRAPAAPVTSGPRADSLSVSTAGGTLTSAGAASRKAETWRRLAEEGANTYLVAMLPQVDSAIRRWPDDRFARPLRVTAVRGGAGFREEFVGAIAWAVEQWNGAQLPLQMDFRGSDSSAADITVRWVTALDSERTGKADITWDQHQAIRRVAVTLATHAPDGRTLTDAEMRALALHELGHAIGLAHSTDPHDALYPTTRVTELSERDRATARLLYELPVGSLRN